MRLVFFGFVLALLAACDIPAPDDGDVNATDEVLVISDETAVVEDEDEATTEDGDVEEIIVVIDTDNPVISDTQNFASLSERETIESDAARLKAQREKFTVIAPTALPTRSGAAGANVVAFALQTTNNVGEKLYKRFGLAAVARQACKRYRLADDAQLAFLKAGGPKRDPKNLDPDGDGFACAWSPVDYRNALN